MKKRFLRMCNIINLFGIVRNAICMWVLFIPPMARKGCKSEVICSTYERLTSCKSHGIIQRILVIFYMTEVARLYIGCLSVLGIFDQPSVKRNDCNQTDHTSSNCSLSFTASLHGRHTSGGPTTTLRTKRSNRNVHKTKDTPMIHKARGTTLLKKLKGIATRSCTTS